jgi:hypothetical protein
MFAAPAAGEHAYRSARTYRERDRQKSSDFDFEEIDDELWDVVQRRAEDSNLYGLAPSGFQDRRLTD